MGLSWEREYVTNWSMTDRSPCYVIKAQTSDHIARALAEARERNLPVIAHGAGHSYTDAALNTGGLLIDLRSMRRILSWDPERGVMQVEPGVTLRDIARIALQQRWWPAVTPSTAEATIGGCVAMNVNGKNAWKCGPFGEHLLSLSVIPANGETLTLSPARDPELFHAVVGSAGLLGIITSITLQLQRVKSNYVDVQMKAAASLHDILALFREEQEADFLEAWLDGSTTGHRLGRGIVTSARYSDANDGKRQPFQVAHRLEGLKVGFARAAGGMCRPFAQSGTRIMNNAMYHWSRWRGETVLRQRSLFEATYYPSAAFAGYRALLPHGTETFQAFVPYEQAEILFKEILQRSYEERFMPLWCIIKQHRRDPFLLSYQVDGFSLEVNYQIVPRTAPRLYSMLRALMEIVVTAGGRFYLAKDALLTHRLYRRSIGDTAVDGFLRLKQRYDPETLFQSDLYRRVFQESRS